VLLLRTNSAIAKPQQRGSLNSFFFFFPFFGVVFGCKWVPSQSFNPFFFSFNVAIFFLLVAPYLFFGVGKKICFILFCGFFNFDK
jgi:hypothetical protein